MEFPACGLLIYDTYVACAGIAVRLGGVSLGINKNAQTLSGIGMTLTDLRITKVFTINFSHLKALLFLALCASFMLGAPSNASANSKYAAFVVHAHSGDVLFDRYSKGKRYPASLTKMMTLYLLFDEIEAGRLTTQSKLKVSSRAAAQPPSKLGVATGSTIDVETAIKALVVKSANDVAVVVAEGVAGSEWRFAQKMTAKARSLGMHRTTFRNASGLPNRKQVTTAQDMATLARRLMQDHAKYWSYFSTKSFAWNGRTYRTHNALLRTYSGADGLKTGYTRRSGYNLATSANRNGNHLIGVVLGGRSSRTRDAHMRKILDTAFSSIKKRPHLIASLHRSRPEPRLKPTLLAQMGASTGAMAAAPETISGNPVLDAELKAAAAALSGDEKDPISALIAANETDDDNILPAEADPYLGEGDIEPAEIWSVQVGAYSTKSLAQKELETIAIIGGLTDRMRIISPTKKHNDKRTMYRARFTKLTEAESTEICQSLRSLHINCFATDKDGSAAF